MTLSEAADLISDAMQYDLENGVAWINEAAAEEFCTKYPHLNEALGRIIDAVADEEDGEDLKPDADAPVQLEFAFVYGGDK